MSSLFKAATVSAVVALVALVAAGGTALAQLAPFADREAVTVTIDVDPAGDTTRLVLTHSREVVYAIQQARGRIEVLYAAPVRSEPQSRRFGGPVLERWEMHGGRRLVLHTGRGFEGHESFELKNPFRLIIDLRGSAERRVPGATAIEPAPRPSGTVIVVDPGHGGVEEGAVGPGGLKEKEVTLDLARRLRSRLARRRGIDVVLTRDEDRLVGLDERSAVANHNRAELFVSIHLNAAPRTAASGAETYYLSADANDQAAQRLAALENSATEASGTVSGRDRHLDLVLWELAQNSHIAQSAALAEAVQRELNELTGTRDRGVRQAPFRVLMGATMPAILVEAGFVTNPEEEQRLRSAAYRDQIVEALARAIEGYVARLERISQRGGRDSRIAP